MQEREAAKDGTRHSNRGSGAPRFRHFQRNTTVTPLQWILHFWYPGASTSRQFQTVCRPWIHRLGKRDLPESVFL